MPPRNKAQTKAGGADHPPLRRSRLSLTARISPYEFTAIAACVFAGLTVLWWAATRFELVPPLFLPSPGAVLFRLSELWSTGKLMDDMLVSIYRITVGF